jgi:hypothetical protein
MILKLRPQRRIDGRYQSVNWCLCGHEGMRYMIYLTHVGALVSTVVLTYENVSVILR